MLTCSAEIPASGYNLGQQTHVFAAATMEKNNKNLCLLAETTSLMSCLYAFFSVSKLPDKASTHASILPNIIQKPRKPKKLADFWVFLSVILADAYRYLRSNHHGQMFFRFY